MPILRIINIRLHHWHKICRLALYSMKVIILAGGKGTRLPISASTIPKVLIEVRGKPLLLHQIEMLKRQGFSDIRLSLGFRSDQVIEYVIDKIGGRYEWIIEDEPLGTGGAIKKACKGLDEDFLVLNGDILADIDLRKFVEHHQTVKKENPEILGTIAVWECQDCRDFGLLKVEPVRFAVAEFLEKPQEKCSGFINAGFYILAPQIFKEIKDSAFSVERDVFSRLASEGKLCYFVHNGRWTDVGTEERLRVVNQG